MKEQILQISDKLRDNKITDKEAQTELCFLFGVIGSLSDVLKIQPDFKLAKEVQEIQAKEVYNYIVNEHEVKLTYEEWRKTVKTYYR